MVMTASIMDYNGDPSDFAGLGRYDRAAVYYSYFDKVEAYTEPDPTVSPDVPADGNVPLSLVGMQRPDLHRRELWTYYRGGESCQVNKDCPFSNGRESTIYQPLAQRCVPNPRLPAAGARPDCSATGKCVCSNFYATARALNQRPANSTATAQVTSVPGGVTTWPAPRVRRVT